LHLGAGAHGAQERRGDNDTDEERHRLIIDEFGDVVMW
jgi:hypothetical protein